MTHSCPDKIFINGPVVTMDLNLSVKQALAATGTHITAVGDKNDILPLGDKNTEIIDLQGRALLPGLIDAHSHFLRAGLYDAFVVNLSSPPVGKILCMDELIDTLKTVAEKMPQREWVMGYSYDDTLLAEKRHPLAKDLDKASLRHPVFIRHVSGHLAVLNSKALAMLGINKDSICCLGGTICKDSAGHPTGLLQGEPAMQFAEEKMPKWTSEHWLQAAQNASDMYAAKGVTSAQEGDAYPGDLDTFLRANAQNLLKPRIQISPSWRFPDELKKFPCQTKGTALTDDLMLSLGAVKLYQDGSIQGYSGYLSRPYYTYLPGAEKDSLGMARNKPEQLNEMIAQAHQQGWQIAVHANGDQAIEEVINAFELAQSKFPRIDCRHIIIHCQTVREDQMDRMQKLRIIPSFFATHIYFWGDRHRLIFLGPQRAKRINPCQNAVDRQMPFTCHNDTYITPIDPLLSVWAAANRYTYGGQCLGKEFRISVPEALRSVTSYAAYQFGEEHIKGSLEPGKLADLVILEDNPLTVAPDKIKDIVINQTLRGGYCIFKK